MASRSIIILDADPAAGKALAARLTKLGFTVALVAASEDEAIPMAAEAPLVIMDVPPGSAERAAASALLKERSCAVLLTISEADEDALRAVPLRHTNGYLSLIHI